MRRLFVLPIVHSRSDLGSLQTVANQVKVAALGERRASTATQSVNDFWQSLRGVLTSLNLDYTRVLLYQDGLPKVQNFALQIEKQIIDDLAKGGSPNHQLVQAMMEQGAALIGTESPELLMQEYHAIRRNLTQGYPEPVGPGSSTLGPQGTQDHCTQDHQLAPERLAKPTLMQQRDRFIADRIDETLGSDQLGLLFIGMLHRVEGYLPADIQVEYPVGRPSASAARFIDRPAINSILTSDT